MKFLAARRGKKFESALPDTLNLLSGSLRAGYSLLQGKTTTVTDDINEVTVQVVNLVTTHRAQMQPQA